MMPIEDIIPKGTKNITVRKTTLDMNKAIDESDASINSYVSSTCPHCRNMVGNVLPEVCPQYDPKTLKCNIIPIDVQNGQQIAKDRGLRFEGVPANELCYTPSGAKHKVCTMIVGSMPPDALKAELKLRNMIQK